MDKEKIFIQTFPTDAIGNLKPPQIEEVLSLHYFSALSIKKQLSPKCSLYLITDKRGKEMVNNFPYDKIITILDDYPYVKPSKMSDYNLYSMEVFKDEKYIHLDNNIILFKPIENVSNVFIPKGEMVVSTKGKVIDWDRSFKTLNNPIDREIPLAVLIDKGSASASEIVSGVLQDLDRGVLVGQRSYGKGLVQNTRDVGYNSRVKMTTAKYYIPSGRCIQGVEYKNGEPVNIPDSLRAEFTTRNGRQVLDGGGVKPDLALESPNDISIIKSLLKENAIFDFATQFAIKNEKIGTVQEFEFTDFDGFVKFLNDTNFEYETQSEKMMKAWMKQAEKEKLLVSIESDISSMIAKIKEEKKNDLVQHKDAIINEIEKEIVGRYYFQRGKIQMGLKNDQEIKDAISILRDQKKYNDLLNNK